jgi:hypothetical protein
MGRRVGGAASSSSSYLCPSLLFRHLPLLLRRGLLCRGPLCFRRRLLTAHRPQPTHTRARQPPYPAANQNAHAHAHTHAQTHRHRERKDGATPQHSAAPREMIGYRCAVIVNHGSRTCCSAPSWARRARLISSTFPSWKPCSQRASAPRHGRGAGCLSVGGGCAACQLGEGVP